MATAVGNTVQEKQSEKRPPDVEAEAFNDKASDFDTLNEHDLGLDPVYQAKAVLLNNALQEIGMGKYQWYLFIVTGFGWFADNLWPIVTGLIIPPVVNEFHFESPFLRLGQNIGLLVGCVFWGIGADIWGRRWSFNLTLLLTSIFAISAGASPDAITLCALTAVWNVGVGGNLPVDSAVFLEFTPPSHQYLLTVLSIWWAFGQLYGSLVAWPLIANFSCASADDCPRASNQGWRYFLYTMGGTMIALFILRFFVFNLYESPKYLMGRGRDAEAVEIVHKIARYNGKDIAFTLDMLREAERRAEPAEDSGADSVILGTGVRAVVSRKLALLSGSHIRPLFATRKLAISTSLLIVIWAFIGLAFSIYTGFITYFLASRGEAFKDGSVYVTYRNQAILSVIGVPGALLAGYMVEIPYLGRRGTLGISTIVTGAFILASTTARTSNALLGWNCAYTFASNIMYGVLYALSPELFPTKHRGTGNALVSAANRVFGILAPIIALYADLTTSVPIYIAGALFVVAGMLAILLPLESRGKASM